MLTEILAFLGAMIILFIILKIISLPIKLIIKLLINALIGGVVLFLINLTGLIVIDITWISWNTRGNNSYFITFLIIENIIIKIRRYI